MALLIQSFNLFLLIFTVNSLDRTPLNLKLNKDRLSNNGEQLTITQVLTQSPDAYTYINDHLTSNIPNKVNLSKQILSIVTDWSPQQLKLDESSPFYFSNKVSNNLLFYLNGVETNTTLSILPFVSDMPQSYLKQIPLFDLFNCNELIDNNYFSTIELIVGPGEAELPLEYIANHGQLFCSLYGRPQFIMINQTTQNIEEKYNKQTLLSLKTDELSKIDYEQTTLDPGSCIFVPIDWILGVHFNNSILFAITFKEVLRDAFDHCTPTNKTLTLSDINWLMSDTLNLTDLQLLVHFYRYLTADTPSYNSSKFLTYAREDKNFAGPILNWTPEIERLIGDNFFHHLDVNNDGYFDINDYYSLKTRALVNETIKKLNNTLEKLKLSIVDQYKDLRKSIAQLADELKNTASPEQVKAKAKQNIQQIMSLLPSAVRDNLPKGQLEQLNSLFNQLKSTETVNGHKVDVKEKKRKRNTKTEF
ncbi:unnamed protein product [Didymodactylos carnosus]|uniref:EF-hand domain-containing protein n=1 Tax=Didymodactylos carnosus TaxID=1234261 RepID=A0A8S2JIR0_9BILA|nr:unnamed protein product [Didymodactylos carnosus]CAF3810464.1 unnamed protein product [Didymodactylos carnosus]